MYVDFNKVQDEEFESQGNFGPLYLENSPRYDIDMCLVFDKVDLNEFESGGKTWNRISFVRHFGEKKRRNGQKSPEIGPNFANLRPPRTHEASAMPPARRSDSEYAKWRKFNSELPAVSFITITSLWSHLYTLIMVTLPKSSRNKWHSTFFAGKKT